MGRIWRPGRSLPVPDLDSPIWKRNQMTSTELFFSSTWQKDTPEFHLHTRKKPKMPQTIIESCFVKSTVKYTLRLQYCGCSTVVAVLWLQYSGCSTAALCFLMMFHTAVKHHHLNTQHPGTAQTPQTAEAPLPEDGSESGRAVDGRTSRTGLTE